MELITGLLLRIVGKELMREKKRLCLSQLSICLKNSLNKEVIDLDRDLVENTGDAFINLTLVAFSKFLQPTKEAVRL